MSAASTAPMPPGVGATELMAEPTRNTTPMLATLTPVAPKACTENDQGGDVGEGQERRPAEELGQLERPARDLADALSGAPQDRQDAFAQHAAPGRQQEQQPGERQDRGETDEHRLARGQEVEGARRRLAPPTAGRRRRG